jgi:hypothetical protein
MNPNRRMTIDNTLAKTGRWMLVEDKLDIR